MDVLKTVNLDELSNFCELFRNFILKCILNSRRTLGYIKGGKTSIPLKLNFNITFVTFRLCK